MHLYHLTARRPDAIDAATVCKWNNQPHYVLARGSWIEIFQITTDDELHIISRQNYFASLRCLETLPANAKTEDQVLATTSAGELLVFTFNRTKVCLEVYWRYQLGTKLKRDEAGEYLVTDSHSRTATVFGIEYNRIIVRFSGNIEKSNIVESHLPFTYCYAVTSLNRGFDFPAFAVLERFRYQDKKITMYEFSMGLNLVVKLWSVTVPEDTNFMIDMGVKLIVFTDQSVFQIQNGKLLMNYDLEMKILCAAKITDNFVLVHLIDGTFLGLIVMEETFKRTSVTIQYDDQSTQPNHSLQLKQLVVSDAGYILGISDYGNHLFFRITSSSRFTLNVSSSLINIAPVTTSLMLKQRLLIGSGSTLLELQPGISSETLVSTPLAFEPSAVFSLKQSFLSKYHDLIVITCKDVTTVLKVDDDGSVEEIGEASTGISANVTTLGVCCLNSGLLQIYKTGFRYITRSALMPKIAPWKASSGLQIIAYASTATQLALALSNRQLLYFKESNGDLLESQQRFDLSDNVTSLAFGYTDDLQSQEVFAALEDETIRQITVPKLKQAKIITVPFLSSSLLVFQNVLYVGHTNGAYSEYIENELRTKVIGTSPVKLIPFSDSVLAISSGVWKLYPQCVPILTQNNFIDMHEFYTEDVQGLLGITNSSLEVLELSANSEKICQTVRALDSCKSHVIHATRFSGKVLTVSKYHISFNEAVYVSKVKIKFGLVVRFGNVEYIAVVVGSKIIILKFDPQTQQFVNVHETILGMNITAILPFKQKLLAAAGNQLWLLDLGQRQLLRHAGITLEDMHHIRALASLRDFVYLGDSQRSAAVVRYDSKEFHLVACDPIPRSITCLIVLDQRTVCCADQYGNIAVLRLEDQVLQSKTGKAGNMELVAHFTVPDACVALYKGSLSSITGTESIIYIGIQGTIGILTPFLGNTIAELFFKLEHHVAEALKMDYKRNRGGAAPRKNVVDGDICELFEDLELDKQSECAETLETSRQALKNHLHVLRGSIV